jgi:hypothetical protein
MSTKFFQEEVAFVTLPCGGKICRSTVADAHRVDAAKVTRLDRRGCRLRLVATPQEYPYLAFIFSRVPHG